MRGRIGYNHSDTCRARVKQSMANDPEYRSFMQQHQWDNNQADEFAGPSNGASIDIISIGYHNERVGHNRKTIHNMHQREKQGTQPGIETQFNQTMLHMLRANMEVAEFYSPARVIQMAREMGLRAGWGLDHTTTDDDGRAWGFNSVEMRNRAIHRALKDRPLLLIGSPVCIAYSTMNNINYCRPNQHHCT